jgi:tRNA threonylcarbamoyladenosine biosynthesis protein TsaB
MALILSIETSTSVCSVALHADGKLVANLELHQEHAHASKLAVLIKEVLKCASTGFEKVSAVAVSSGPGSYTGLRIGTSLAKGLCYALEVPLIAVSSLNILASRVAAIDTTDALLCPMIDARRMEVYCQIFDHALEELVPMQAVVVDEHSFATYLKGSQMIFFGDGAMKCRDVIANTNAIFLPDITTSAVQLGFAAYGKLRQEQFEDLSQFSPYYLKEFFVKKATEKLNETR